MLGNNVPNHDHGPDTAVWVIICVLICMLHVCDDSAHTKQLPDNIQIEEVKHEDDNRN